MTKTMTIAGAKKFMNELKDQISEMVREVERYASIEINESFSSIVEEGAKRNVQAKVEELVDQRKAKEFFRFGCADINDLLNKIEIDIERLEELKILILQNTQEQAILSAKKDAILGKIVLYESLLHSGLTDRVCLSDVDMNIMGLSGDKLLYTATITGRQNLITRNCLTATELEMQLVADINVLRDKLAKIEEQIAYLDNTKKIRIKV